MEYVIYDRELEDIKLNKWVSNRVYQRINIVYAQTIWHTSSG